MLSIEKRSFLCIKQAIVNASNLPLSIIIVGVGNAIFDKMEQLDADTVPLRCPETLRLMERDIVQFVPYRQFRADPRNPASLARLAQEVPRAISHLTFYNNAIMQ